MFTDRERLILLNAVTEVGSNRLQRLLEAFGSLQRVFAATPQQLQQVEGIGPQAAERIVVGCRDTARLQRELAQAQRRGAALITLLEEERYPTRLKAIHDPPLALYVRGELPASDAVCVAIVGARRASTYGLQAAERLGYELALRGITIVSGLARGIDGAAHRGALKAGGRTVAVLGSGLNRPYPPDHVELAEQIAKQGAVISEYPMETEPLPHNFPRRNRIISGLSHGVVVVEAGPKSGALITADCALEQGREVFAVPGPITSVVSQGTHNLLKQGAKLVTSVDDILEELTPFSAQGSGVRAQTRAAGDSGLRGRPEPSARSPEPISLPAHSPQPNTAAGLELPAVERRVLTSVEAETPLYVDAIVERSGLTAHEVSATLLQLELKLLVRQLPGKRFVRTDQV